jgi:hypothetical protein
MRQLPLPRHCRRVLQTQEPPGLALPHFVQASESVQPVSTIKLHIQVGVARAWAGLSITCHRRQLCCM